MNPSWKEAFRLRDVVDKFLHSVSTFLENEGYSPKNGSKAAMEKQEYPNSEAIDTAYSQAYLLIEYIADHIFAMLNTLKNPGEAYAPWTLMRVVLESSAKACFILDPSILARTRIERSISLRRQEMQEQAKFCRTARMDHELEEAKLRIKEIDKNARVLQLKAKQNKKGEVLCYGQVMPNISAMISNIFNDEESYRLFSAMLHCQIWAMISLGSKRINNTDARLLEKHMEPLSAVFLLLKATKCISMAVWYLSKQYSYNLDALRIIYNGTYDAFGVAQDTEIRFWNDKA